MHSSTAPWTVLGHDARMELRPILVTTHAAARHDMRARRMSQVKFVALAMPLPDEYPQAFAQGTGARASYATTLRNLLSRVIGRLVAARP